MTSPLQIPADQIWCALAALFAGALIIILIIGRIDQRRLGGDPIWSKPMKFSLSLCVHFATFGVITHALPQSIRDSVGLQFTAIISAAAGLFEVAYISFQAARGRHSHFNTRTAFEGAMAMLMGVGAILVLVPAIVIGFTVLTGPLPQWSWALRAGVIAGLWCGSALTLTTGMAMGAVQNRLVAGAPRPSRTVWLTGWSLDGGDMRPAHFLATHMMQGIPLVALFASMTLPEPGALTVVGLVSAGWILATMAASTWATSLREMPRPFGIIATPQIEK